jgi:hypothetical protein
MKLRLLAAAFICSASLDTTTCRQQKHKSGQKHVDQNTDLVITMDL